MSGHVGRFDGLADAYDQHRPDYPPALFERLVSRAPSAPPLAVDVAAGTGISTRRLLEAAPPGWRVAAIEPGIDMRRVLTRRFADEPRVCVREGLAEAMGVETGAAAVLSAATAFHWFDHRRFFVEAARVLTPGGALGVVRNRRFAQPVLDAFDVFVRQRSPEDASAWRLSAEAECDIVRAAPGFDAFECFETTWSRPINCDGLIAMYLTRSTVAALVGDIGREAVVDRFRALYAENVGAAAIRLDYRATALIMRRV